LKVLGLLAEYPAPEFERRAAAIRAAASPGVEVVVEVVPGNVFRGGMTDRDRTEIAPVMTRAAIDAEARGFDAVVPYGTLDLGVEEARRAVSIPVVGPGRATVHLAETLCDRFAIVCYDEAHVVMFTKLIRAWRVVDDVTGIHAVGVEVTAMADSREHLRARFIEVARRAVADEGAQLIAPLGMTMVPVTFAAAELAAEIGVPVLDPLATAMRLAETLAAGGVTNSRAAYPHLSPDGEPAQR
jgi:Asp/Glu/hydantoin racemase